METRRYAYSQVVNAIEADGVAKAKEYNIDAIIDKSFTFDPVHGYQWAVGPEEFWQIVRDNEL